MNYLVLKFNDVNLNPRDIAKVRGYFSSKFRDNNLLHNHLPGGKFSYKFPQIQFRLVDGHPTLIGLKDGIEVLKEVFFLNQDLSINGVTYRLNEKEITSYKSEIGQTDTMHHYRFSAPYMALNQENHKKYTTMNSIEKQSFIKLLIRENLKTLSKGFDYHIPDLEKIKVEGIFQEKRVNFKNLSMLCFTGEFMVNFIIPEHWGIGKQTARGFGVVKLIEKKC